MQPKGFFYLFTACLILTGVIMAAAPADLLTVENKFIKIFINNSPEETGRFAVDVTKGDPEREDDDNKPLIYGHPKPWTSFTTIRINGQNYVFGKTTNKRAGAGLPGGEMVIPPQLKESRLIMKCKYDSVTVEQVLDIAYSTSTGAPDTARIRYTVVNEGTTPAEVGIRALLDTMVGNNDAAPFRAGDWEITYEYSLNRNEVPDFWQAFDSIATPAVIAQGTLKGGDVTAPDRIIFTNWGKAADEPWEFPVQSGTSFLRLGEEELDSAVVMFWEPKVLKPGEKFDTVIYYGLGGITFAPGKTYLGISAPAEVRYSIDQPQSYTVVMYMEHRGDTIAKNVKAKLTLPAGLELVSGQDTTTLPELQPGVTRQISWLIRPNGQGRGETSFQIRVTGDGLEANQVSRKIRIIGPPAIKAKLSVPVVKVLNNGWSPYPVPVSINLTSTGDAAANDLKVELTTGEGVDLAQGESPIKFVDQLNPGEQVTLNWKVVPVSGNPNSQLKVAIAGTGIKPVTLVDKFSIPPLPAKLVLEPVGELIGGEPVCLNVVAYNLRNIKEFTCDIVYDPQKLRLVHISRGDLLVEGDAFADWNPGRINRQNGVVTGIRGSREQPYNGNAPVLFTLNFMAVEPGEGGIQFNRVVIKDAKGKELQFDIIPFQYRVKEGK